MDHIKYNIENYTNSRKKTQAFKNIACDAGLEKDILNLTPKSSSISKLIN